MNKQNNGILQLVKITKKIQFENKKPKSSHTFSRMHIYALNIYVYTGIHVHNKLA